MLKKDIHDLNKITAKDISEFITCTLPYSKKSVYRNLRFLKGLFRAIYFEELTDKDYSKEMPKLYFKDADFSPPVWTEDEINRILNAVDQGSPIGKRDYAMLLLVARTGIRNSDLRRLKLTDINWDTKEISFEQYKAKQPLTLPLLEDVGWAIIEYLKNGRPKTDCPNVFVTHNKPYVEFKSCYYRLKEYLNDAGITVNQDKNIGVHSLRHTLVNRLLEENVPTDTISAILGHGSPESINNYLHTDIKTLNNVL